MNTFEQGENIIIRIHTNSDAANELVEKHIWREISVRNFIQDLENIIALNLHSIDITYYARGCITLLVFLVLNADTTDHNIVEQVLGCALTY